MKHTKMLVTLVLVVSVSVMIVFIGVNKDGATVSADESMSILGVEEDMTVYIMDDNGDFYIEIISPDTTISREQIAEEDMTAFMEKTTSGQRLFFHEPVNYEGALDCDFHEDLPEEERTAHMSDDDLDAKLKVSLHSFGAWQPNPSWCFRICSKCGSSELKGHAPTSYASVSATHYSAYCPSCNQPHGNIIN